MTDSLRLEELTREEVRELAADATVLVPVAATEQHGPHLPLQTDSLIGEAVAFRAATAAAAHVPIVVAPLLPYGYSAHHLFACAMSLTSATFLSVVNDLADSLAVSGFRRLFFLTSHGGNTECVRLLAKDVVTRHDVAVAGCAYWEVAESAARGAGVEELGFFPGHAGGFETSVMLALAPDRVRLDRLPREDPSPLPFARRVVAPGLMLQKAGEWPRIGGYSDAPIHATAEAGHRLLGAIAGAVSQAIVAFHREAF